MKASVLAFAAFALLSTGAFAQSKGEVTYVDAINQALLEEMERDSSVVVMGQDIGAFEGAFRTTKGLYARWPHRVLDTPIAESGTIGIAIGAGTDVAVEAGDVVLVRSDPRDVPRIIALSRASRAGGSSSDRISATALTKRRLEGPSGAVRSIGETAITSPNAASAAPISAWGLPWRPRRLEPRAIA